MDKDTNTETLSPIARKLKNKSVRHLTDLIAYGTKVKFKIESESHVKKGIVILILSNDYVMVAEDRYGSGKVDMYKVHLKDIW